MALPSLGTLTYGGVNFNGPAVLTKSISMKPRMDSAGRGRTWTEYTLSLRLFLTGYPNDPFVLAARTTLQQPGLPLIYSDKGYGPVVLNVGTSSDAIWGPITKELGFEQLGNGNACYLDWQVSVAIPGDGFGPNGTAAPFIEIMYSVGTDIDRAGYTTRRISVMGRVPGVRLDNSGGAELAGTADDYREYFAPPLLPGFERTYPNWHIDEGKTVVTGEIVDTELGLNFLPPGVAVGSASHEVSSSAPGLAMWQASISADFELEKDAPIDQYDLVNYFVNVLCKDRISDTAAAIGANSKAIVPISFKMAENEIFGRLKASMAFSYTFSQDFKKIFGSTGLWRPVPGSDWLNWATSMLDGPANPRGYAQIALQPEDDSIVDGYGGRLPGIFQNFPPTPPPDEGPVLVGVPDPPAKQVRELRAGLAPFPDPTPENSYISYETWIWLEVDSGVVPVRPLPMTTPNLINSVLTGNPFAAVQSIGQNIFDAVTDAIGGAMPANVPQGLFAGAGNLVNAGSPQQRLAPITYVFLRGSGMRYGFPVPIPALTAYCGATPVLSCRLDKGEGYGHGIKRAANGNPIYMASWNLRYMLPFGMQPFFFPPAIPNPLLDTP